MKTVKFFTLGCKVNQYETQEMRERFREAGLREVSGKKRADVYVVNTCTVTANADKDSRYCIHRSHRENPSGQIIVTGCLAQLEPQSIARLPGVRAVVPHQDKATIASGFSRGLAVCGEGITDFQGHTRVFLKVQDGCNNRCRYCRVPLARGRSRSKEAHIAIREARGLVEEGFKEIVLTGICLGAYGRDLKPARDLVDLIEGLEGIEGLVRIRLSSIEASDVSARLIGKLARSRKLCRHLHMPVQSGDDEVLRSMGRTYRRRDYLALVRKLRERVPLLAISTDVLVGFPGETDRHFSNTMDLVRRICPVRTHGFPFSPRPGTKAFGMTGRLPPELLEKRMAKLKTLAEECADAFRNKCAGTDQPVLIEGRSKSRAGFWEGYTDTYLKVLVKSKKDLKNRMISVPLSSEAR